MAMMQTPQFGGFQPSGKAKIAQSMGFQGPMEQFDQFLQDNPDKQSEMMRYEDFARKMVSGGYVQKMSDGGMLEVDSSGTPIGYTPDTLATSKQQKDVPPQTMGDIALERLDTPALPVGGKVTPVGTLLDPRQDVGVSTTGQSALTPVSTDISAQVADAGDVAQVSMLPDADPTRTATTMQPTTSAQDVATALDATQAAQGTVDPKAEIIAAQQTASSVVDVDAAQGNAVLMTNPVQRQIQDGELVSPAANAEKAAQFTEQVQAAESTPTKQATVQGQLETLMQQFEGGNTPPWAAGAMRNVQAEMAKRGLGASSMAAQAMMQAALEASLPIAQMDASTIAKFETQNLSNRQQRAILAAEQRASFLGMEFTQQFQSRVANSQRIGEIANMNFTADQNIALENSRAANTMNMANLSNSQALVMAEAAALSQLDMSNLNNRQQSAVQNAQNFLSMDMQNLSNQQQTDMFKSQQSVQALFTDQAARNAAAQFNATSQNQTDQFFASLDNASKQFNVAQQNAHNQQNAGRADAMTQFQEQINNQRDQFLAQQRLVIDQSNVNWRRQVATADTVAVNRANELNASALLNMSDAAYNNLWQYYGDSMEWAWTSAENERSRVANLAIEQLRADSNANVKEMMLDYQSSASFGKLIGTILTASSGSFIGSLLGVG
jgi:hypothetical protein